MNEKTTEQVLGFASDFSVKVFAKLKEWKDDDKLWGQSQVQKVSIREGLEPNAYVEAAAYLTLLAMRDEPRNGGTV